MAPSLSERVLDARRRLRRWVTQQALAHRLLPVIEDGAQVAAYERVDRLAERAEGQRVADAVGDGPAGSVGEDVLVFPQGIRAAQRAIDEADRGIPELDRSDPGSGSESAARAV